MPLPRLQKPLLLVPRNGSGLTLSSRVRALCHWRVAMREHKSELHALESCRLLVHGTAEGSEQHSPCDISPCIWFQAM